MWNRGIYENFTFANNVVIGHRTNTPRSEGLFGFPPSDRKGNRTDFDTIQIRDNRIELRGLDRPLMRNEASYASVIENNELIGISDQDRFGNEETEAKRGLTTPLRFKVGAFGAFEIDGNAIAKQARRRGE